MRIKKFTAASMKEALLEIKQDLGEEAMILNTRKIPKKMFAFGDQNTIEVTAAIDERGLPTAKPMSPITMQNPGTYTQKGLKRKPEPVQSTTMVAEEPLEEQKDSALLPDEEVGKLTQRFQIQELREDLSKMRVLLASILATGETAAAGGFAGPWAILYKRLADSEIRLDIATDLVNKLKNTTESPDRDINKKFISVLCESFPVSGPFRLKNDGPLLVTMVGPTGSGKTTTIAKLASYYNLNRGKSVSLITADTYRLAAIEQIRSFAEIVDIGLQVIFAPDEVEEALESCGNDDIVFIDTAGRSPNNKDHMQDLERLLNHLNPHEVHLVLSATTKDSDLKVAVKRYKELKANRLLFTKLDETTHLGNVFNTVSESGLPASYCTFGQSVPDDIELAQSGRFIQKLLERSSI